jgi:hypothetical protein
MRTITLIFLIFVTFRLDLEAQPAYYGLLDQRLNDLEKETRKIESERNALAYKVNDLQNVIAQQRKNATLFRKQIERNERALVRVIEDLYNAQNMLLVKMADVSLLTMQIGVIQSEKDSLKEQLNTLSKTESYLHQQLDSTIIQLNRVTSENERFKEQAKESSLNNSMAIPRGYRPKPFSVYIIEPGIVDITRGFTLDVSSYSYIAPSRSMLAGARIGMDFYSANPGSLFAIPISASIRGNFGPQDYFTASTDTAALRFNINWVVDVGWSFLVKDTDTAQPYKPNLFMNAGVGILWPIQQKFGMGLSAQLKMQRLIRTYSSGKTAELFPLAVFKVAFYLRR